MRNKKNVVIGAVTIILVLFTIFFFGYAFYQKGIVAKQYENAITLYKEGRYQEALKIFNTLHDYKDANEFKSETEKWIIYLEASELLNNESYDEAIQKLSMIIGFEDSVNKINEARYGLAMREYKAGEYDSARNIFSELGDYKDSKLYLAQIDIEKIEETKKIIYEEAESLYKLQQYEEALKLFEMVLDYSNAIELFNDCKLQLIRRNSNNVLSAGVINSMAILDDGTVIAVGNNDEKQCEVATWNDIVSIDSYGCFSIGLDKTGRVKLAGVYDGKDVVIDTWENIVDVAVGERFVVGLKADGTVVADGHNANRQLNVGEWKDVIAIDAGWNYTVGLTQNKELLFAGKDNGQREEFISKKDEWKDVVNIAASGGGDHYKCRGKGHTVGLKSDGTVVAIGDNSYGQCDVYEWDEIIKVVAGDWYTVGLKEDGTIVITGENFPGSYYINDEVIAECKDIIDIAAGFGHTVCLHKDGTVTAFGFNDDNKSSGTLAWENIMKPKFIMLE